VPATLVYWPPGDLRLLLLEARREGLDFDEAWKVAMRTVRFPKGGSGAASDLNGRAAWRQVLEATKPEWRRAYDRVPSPHGEALVALAEALDTTGSELPERFRSAA
jgi:hypothetical protein